MENVKDPELWKLAQKRAGFKQHAILYVIMNIFFWLLWYFTKQGYSGDNNIPWPVWATLGWGIGLFFQYRAAYVYPKSNSAEKEYYKLKNKQS